MDDAEWEKVFCHVDADAFYCGAEKVRRPELAALPICVLSSNDACVVSKCYRAKAAGIKTGMPVWEAKEILPEGVFLSADFGFYGQISEHMFMVFRQFAPVVEAYSIDEAFIDASGLICLHGSYRAFADRLRMEVLRQVGVTVSVGVSVTRTLAKMASEFNKPNGTTILSREAVPAFLERVELTDIPGIARGRSATLEGMGIATAGAFAAAPRPLIGGLLGKVGLELHQELNGVSVYPVVPDAPPPQSISRTASLGEVTGSRETLLAHLTHHLTRACCELTARKLVAAHLVVFVRHKSFDAVSMEFRLRRGTNAFSRLMALVREALDQLFRHGELYRGCGVVLGQIAKEAQQSLDLFGDGERDRRKADVMRVLMDINRKYGNGSAMMLATLPVRRIRRAARFRYPMLYVN